MLKRKEHRFGIDLHHFW